MKRIWGERALLAAIGTVGASNGFFLGLTLAALLTLLMQIAEWGPPPGVVAPIGGGAAALAVLGISLLREYSLAEREVPSWALDPPLTGLEADWEEVVADLAWATDLVAPPRLRFVESEVPNAFALGDPDGEGAAITVTKAALEQLTPLELLAVLAHEVAHVEAGDLRAVALADSVQATVAGLSDLKGRYLWGPRQILRHGLPLITFMGIGALFVLAMKRQALEAPVGVAGFAVVIGVMKGWEDRGWRDPIIRLFKRSWMAIFQFALWMSLFGFLTLVEALLAWPTVFALSRLLSRSRVFAADQRAVELTGDSAGLRNALEVLAPVELGIAEAHFARLRFSLFITPRPRSGYRAWVERITGTHPSAARRIEHLLGSATQLPSRFSNVQGMQSDRWLNRGR